MLSKVHSGCIVGIDAYPVDVEVDVSNGLPSFSVVGLPDAAIRESRDRIRSAIKNSGFAFPSGKITVNLSPADIKKEGVGLDLPIAVGILSASGVIEARDLEETLFIGELSLNGKVKKVRGALPLAISLKGRCQNFIVPKNNVNETIAVKDINIIGTSTLRETIEHLKGIKLIEQMEMVPPVITLDSLPSDVDFEDVKGQEHVKRGLEIAASGGHNMLMLGPPGSGKSMLAKRFPTILPDLSMEESLEITKIYSIAGELKQDGLVTTRPIRSPHHTISYAAMTGGGTIPRPGEITMAHNGILFLDELPEFRRNVLETLREPLESGEITIARAERTLTFPSRFIFIAAMNPCPCGYFTDPDKTCHCTSSQIQRYLLKISGPLMDRIDIHIETPRLKYKELSAKRDGESSTSIKTRVKKVRYIQKERFSEKPTYTACNAHMNQKELEKYCTLTGEAEEILKSAILELGMSARGYDKTLKISRTIADMEGSGKIESHHISEAIGYRCLDRNLF